MTTPYELEFYQHKVVHPDDLLHWSDNIHSENLTIATLNGSFDLLHAGHLHILFEASKLADRLIVGLNSDTSIQQYKSANRPIIALEHRLKMMAALEFVDHVTWFNETDPCKLLSLIKPDVHVNGAEYGEDCIEAPTVRLFGGRIQCIGLVPGLSTSSIIDKVQSLCV